MPGTGGPSRRALRACIFATAALALYGCGERASVMSAEDRAALRRIRDMDLRATTIGAVDGETYPELAWHEVQRDYVPPYRPLSFGALFAWDFLDRQLTDREKERAAAERERQRARHARTQEKAEASEKPPEASRTGKPRKPEPQKEPVPAGKPAPRDGDRPPAKDLASPAAPPPADADAPATGTGTAPAADADGEGAPAE